MSEDIIEMEKKVTTNSHNRGSEIIHNIRRKYAKENGKSKEMIQEVFDREIAEL